MTEQNNLACSNRGFTLIEIVMVLVLLGFIASIAAAKYFDMQEKAEAQTCAANRDTLTANLRAAWADTVLAGKTPDLTALYGTLPDKPVCPTSRQAYTLVTAADGDLHNFTIECATHGGTAVPAKTPGDYIADILDAFAANRAGNNTLDSGANFDSTNKTATRKGVEALLGNGIDITQLNAETWRYQHSPQAFFWTTADIQGLANNTKVPVVKYDAASKTYRLSYARVSTITLERDGINHTYQVLNPVSDAIDNGNQYNTAQEALNVLKTFQQ